MNPATQAHTIFAPAPLCEAGNDAILKRLDREHATAFETARRLQAEAVEADGGDVMMMSDREWQDISIGYVQTPAGEAAEKASHAAWLAFEAIGNAAACFTATSLEGLTSKTRISRAKAAP